MEKVELKVAGMTCGGCVKSIQNALTGRNGVDNAVADLEAGTVAIEFDGKLIQRSALEQAIVDAGFEIAA
jgi:copper chaperone